MKDKVLNVNLASTLSRYLGLVDRVSTRGDRIGTKELQEVEYFAQPFF